jgi:ElaB/YqjD/DUF883 family membrane-anchored ribosome-binding protein
MADTTTPFRGAKAEASQALNQVKSEMSQWVDALDFDRMGKQVQEFGREKPFALAIAALTVGFAAGLLIKRKAGGEIPSASTR